MSLEIFRRVEQKYLIDEKQYTSLLKEIDTKISKDAYFKETIKNIYFDTDDYYLITRSIEKPPFKIKLRVRAYNNVEDKDKVFFEIKNKYKGIVGKRRVEITYKELKDYINNKIIPKNANSQIMKELDYFMNYYNLKPKILIAYDRYSYYSNENKNFRITFDHNLRSNETNLSLNNNEKLLPFFNNKKMIIMEVKSLDSLPFWFIKSLENNKIYPTSFSKYGSIYTNKLKEELINV